MVKDYQKLAAIPKNKGYVRHMSYIDKNGRDATLFPAFRSPDYLEEELSSVPSPIQVNTIPLSHRTAEKFANNYHELVQEFRPKNKNKDKNDPNNLLILGRDELYRSETKSESKHVLPVSRPPDVPAKSCVVSPSEGSEVFTMSPLRQPPRWRSKSASVAQGNANVNVVPKMRYIYAYPEEFHHIVSHGLHETVEHHRRTTTTTTTPGSGPGPGPGPGQRSPTKRLISFDSSLLEEYPHSDTTPTRERDYTESKPEPEPADTSLPSAAATEDDAIYQPPPTLPVHRQSPDETTGTSATTRASQFTFRRFGQDPDAGRKFSPVSQNQPRKSSGNLNSILQDTPAHVIPLVERFILAYFDDPQKAFDHTEYVDATDHPMKHYWQRIFRLKDDSKQATIKIENLLTIEPEIGPFSGFQAAGGGPPTNRRFQASKSQPLGKSQPLSSSRRISVDSEGDGSGESGFSSSPRASADSFMSPPVDIDVLTVVLRKIRQKQPLDWPELFLLKNDHCRFVIERERELRRLRRQAMTVPEAKMLERDIVDNYRCYQRALEQVVVVDELYTRLAYLIMRAEAYWYAARITSDVVLQRHFYALAKHNYGDLLVEARAGLVADDRSLLTILEKMTQILVESGTHDPGLVNDCQQAVILAEKAVEHKPDVRKERKIIKIKTNLLTLNAPNNH